MAVGFCDCTDVELDLREGGVWSWRFAEDVLLPEWSRDAGKMFDSGRLFLGDCICWGRVLGGDNAIVDVYDVVEAECHHLVPGCTLRSVDIGEDGFSAGIEALGYEQ